MPFEKIKQQLGDVADAVAEKAIEVGEAASEVVSATAQKTAEAAADGVEKLQIARYHPVSQETLESPDFTMPKLVTIVDNSERQDIAVMQGAIGWLSDEAGVKVLHLYEKAIEQSGISFFPYPECWSVFYVDRFSERYVNLDSFFKTMLDEKLAELQDVAYCLGAKECTVKVYEKAKQIKVKKGHLAGGAKGKVTNQKASADVSLDANAEAIKNAERKAVLTQQFKGSDTPTVPELKWFKDDPKIQQLIKARCDEASDNKVNVHHLYIENNISASMNAKAAAKIDGALKKMVADLDVSIEGEALEEQRQVFELDVVF